MVPLECPHATGQACSPRALIHQYPSLPVEEEGRLNDPHLRENFVERVFAYRRLRSFFSSRWTLGGLVQFHTAHKLVLMAHSPKAYSELGRFVANAKRLARDKVPEYYELAFMKALKKLATTARHTNVLHHMLGYLRPHLRWRCMRRTSHAYRGLPTRPCAAGRADRALSALGAKVRYRLFAQVYLEPHPKELMLRNHV